MVNRWLLRTGRRIQRSFGRGVIATLSVLVLAQALQVVGVLPASFPWILVSFAAGVVVTGLSLALHSRIEAVYERHDLSAWAPEVAIMVGLQVMALLVFPGVNPLIDSTGGGALAGIALAVVAGTVVGALLFLVRPRFRAWLEDLLAY